MAERISLVEQYDNKDMIVQMKKCLDRTADAVSVSTEARDTAAASAAEAHTASTNANAASTQAQTAAATVATYGTRLQAVEDESAGNRSSIQNIDGEITDIYNDLTNVVRKVGDPEQIVYNGLELRGTNRTPDTTVGQLNDLIVNAKRLIQEINTKLNSYEQMVRTTGNQVVGGVKYVWTPYYIGTIAQNTTAEYSDLGAVASRNSFCTVSLSIVGRGNYLLGVITANESAEGVITGTFAGSKSEGTTIRVCLAAFDDGVHLLLKRNSAAGQGVSVTIFGIGNVTSARVPVPKDLLPQVVPAGDIVEVCRI